MGVMVIDHSRVNHSLAFDPLACQIVELSATERWMLDPLTGQRLHQDGYHEIHLTIGPDYQRGYLGYQGTQEFPIALLQSASSLKTVRQAGVYRPQVPSPHLDDALLPSAEVDLRPAWQIACDFPDVGVLAPIVASRLEQRQRLEAAGQENILRAGEYLAETAKSFADALRVTRSFDKQRVALHQLLNSGWRLHLGPLRKAVTRFTSAAVSRHLAFERAYLQTESAQRAREEAKAGAQQAEHAWSLETLRALAPHSPVAAGLVSLTDLCGSAMQSLRSPLTCLEDIEQVLDSPADQLRGRIAAIREASAAALPELSMVHQQFCAHQFSRYFDAPESTAGIERRVTGLGNALSKRDIKDTVNRLRRALQRIATSWTNVQDSIQTEVSETVSFLVDAGERSSGDGILDAGEDSGGLLDVGAADSYGELLSLDRDLNTADVTSPQAARRA